MSKFNPKRKEKKIVLNVTIDESLMKMLEDIMKGFQTNLSSATNDVLDYFKTEIWDKDLVTKNKDEEEQEDHKKNKSKEDIQK